MRELLERFFSSTITRLLALLVMIAALPLPFLQSFIAVRDPDIWWHIRVGDWILEHNAVPHVGIYSQHATMHAWTAYSWSLEVLMSWLYRGWGEAALPVWLALVQGVLLFTLFMVLRRVAQNFWVAWCLTAATILAMAPILSIRPLLFSIVFFIVEMGAIAKALRTESARPLYWLPLMYIVWANIHVQFVYGLAVLCLFALCAVVTVAAGKLQWTWVPASSLPNDALKLAAVAAACAVAACLGPYGAGLYKVVFGYAGNTAQYDQILELSSLSFRNPLHYVELMIAMGAFFALGWKRRWDPFRAGLLVVVTAVAFRSNRDVWYLVVVAAVWIAESLRDGMPGAAPDATPTRRYAMTFVVAMTLVFTVASSRQYLNKMALINAIDAEFPLRASNYIEDHKLQGPMYNTLNWGGFLIRNLKQYPVSIDGRNDFYGAAFDTNAIATVNGRAWTQDPDLAKANFVVIERQLPLSYVLAENPDWSLVYHDELAAVFVRKVPVK